MKALIAMSGGVDSSVSACLMKERGFECIGATMRLFDNEDAGVEREKSCCSLDDVLDARSVADRLGIPFYVFNFTEEFRKQVIGRFIEAYENGMTPNPCIDCNRYMKFRKFYQRGKELNADYIVTGHYARIEKQNGRYVLKKAIDDTKDQSYVLYSMTQDELAHTVFPLGNMTKDETRKTAESHGFINAHKKDSQDICFVPDGDYAKVIKLNTGKTYPSGDFAFKDGTIVGKHEGIINYTVGQRKGLGIALGKPAYVIDIDTVNNRVILGDNEDLFKTELTADNMNWIKYENPPEEFRAKAKIRYNQKEKNCTVKVQENGKIKVIFDEPQRAVTPGQAVVLYDGDDVIGGGTILKGE